MGVFWVVQSLLRPRVSPEQQLELLRQANEGRAHLNEHLALGDLRHPHELVWDKLGGLWARNATHRLVEEIPVGLGLILESAASHLKAERATFLSSSWIPHRFLTFQATSVYRGSLCDQLLRLLRLLVLPGLFLFGFSLFHRLLGHTLSGLHTCGGYLLPERLADALAAMTRIQLKL